MFGASEVGLDEGQVIEDPRAGLEVLRAEVCLSRTFEVVNGDSGQGEGTPNPGLVRADREGLPILRGLEFVVTELVVAEPCVVVGVGSKRIPCERLKEPLKSEGVLPLGDEFQAGAIGTLRLNLRRIDWGAALVLKAWVARAARAQDQEECPAHSASSHFSSPDRLASKRCCK